MATENPVIYIAIYRGAEAGSDNIKNDPYLKKADPIDSSLYVTRDMAIAKGEFELRKRQKIVKARSLDVNRIGDHILNIEKNHIVRLRDDRAYIEDEQTVVKGYEFSIDFNPGQTRFSMSVNVESYENIPYHFGREMALYNGV